MNQNKSTAAIFFDIEKAFDTVWHDGLIFKLKENNIPQYIIKMIDSFLHERTFRVKIGTRDQNRDQSAQDSNGDHQRVNIVAAASIGRKQNQSFSGLQELGFYAQKE